MPWIHPAFRSLPKYFVLELNCMLSAASDRASHARQVCLNAHTLGRGTVRNGGTFFCAQDVGAISFRPTAPSGSASRSSLRVRRTAVASVSFTREFPVNPSAADSCRADGRRPAGVPAAHDLAYFAKYQHAKYCGRGRPAHGRSVGDSRARWGPYGSTCCKVPSCLVGERMEVGRCVCTEIVRMRFLKWWGRILYPFRPLNIHLASLLIGVPERLVAAIPRPRCVRIGGMGERPHKRYGPIGWLVRRSRRFWITASIMTALAVVLYPFAYGPVAVDSIWLVS
jgi:hypothetical protein